MSAFTDLLADFQSEKVQLCCLQPYDPDGAGVVTLYYSTQGFTSEPSDTPANTSYSPRIKGSFDYQRSLYADNKLSGRSLPGLGTLVLNNDDGGIDALADYSWKGRRVRIWLGDRTFGLSDYGLIFDGIIEFVEFGDSDFTVHLSDAQVLLDGEIQSATFLGTGGAEGAADLANKRKPFGIGPCRNVAPVYLGPDTGTHKFSVGDGAIIGVLRVLDVGVPLTFAASAPAAGEWTVDAATGVITLGGGFIGPITCDFIGRRYLSTTSVTSWSVANGSKTFTVASSSGLAVGMMMRVARTSALHSTWGDGKITTIVGTAVTINITSNSGAVGPFTDWTLSPWGTVAGGVKYLSGLRGVTSFDTASFTALDLAQPATVFLWVPEGGNALSLLDTLVDGAGCFYGGKRNGQFDVGRLGAPGTPAARYDGLKVLKIVRNKIADPVYSVTVRYRKNHNVLQLNQVDGTAADADKTFLTTEWRQAVAADTGILTAYPQAAAITVDSCFDESTAAAAEATRLLGLFGVHRDYFTVTLKVQPLAHELSDTITIEHTRYGLSAGVDLLIVNFTADLNKYQIECGLWG
jgi:hypothetical protein